MSVGALVPAIFHKAIAGADLVDPDDLPVIQARREVVGNMILQPRRSYSTFVRQLHVRDGYFGPEAGLPGRHFIDRGIWEIAGRLKDRRINIALRGFHITLVRESTDDVADHLASPFHESVRIQLGDGRVQGLIIGRLAAQVDARLQDAPDNVTCRKLRQSLGACEIFEIKILWRAKGECPQTNTCDLEKVTTREV